MFVGMGANGAGGYNLTDSVRFRSSATSYLDRTQLSGNQQKWTFSAWVKRGAIGTYSVLMAAHKSGVTELTEIYFHSDDTLYVALASGTQAWFRKTNRVCRDTSAWYHVVGSVDTTNDSIRVWVNNEESTAAISGAGSFTNFNTHFNSSTAACSIGRRPVMNTWHFDGYMTEVNFIDGQQLTPSDFGEYDNTTGVWKPKEYTGSYGTNGFYLPMKATTQASGFNTVLWEGNGTGQSITGVGFKPDFVWLKNRDSGSQSLAIYDVQRGAGYTLRTNSTLGDTYQSGLTSFDADGFTMDNVYNTASNRYVSWCFEAGGTAVSNTDGGITSNVSANTAKGFSIVTYTGTGSTTTVGHGLTSAPELIIGRTRDSVSDWTVGGSLSPFSSGTKILKLNTTDALLSNSEKFKSVTNTTFGIGVANSNNNSGDSHIAYCFHSVSGFSKFGTYNGNGSASGPTITTGFRPAFVMIKRTDTTSGWVMFDNTRDADGVLSEYLQANSSGSEISASYADISDTGFTINSTFGNAAGSTFIYMAFADTRDFQWNFDASGNKNNFTPVNINSNASSETSYDIMSDVPTLTDEDTGNFATFNPLDSAVSVVSGNLQTSGSASYTEACASIAMTSGKWYIEGVASSLGDGGIGITRTTNSGLSHTAVDSYRTIYQASGTIFRNGTGLSNTSVATYTTSDVIGIAMDLDSGTLAFYKNNTLIDSTTNSVYAGTNNSWKFYVLSQNTNWAVNFGQRPFVYTPPTGYKKLNTFNLPDSAIKDGSQYMNPVLYTGDGSSSRSITGLGFSPDLVWVRQRNIAQSHTITDSVRGAGKIIASDAPNGEYTATTYGQITSFDSDGFTASKGSDPTYSYYNISSGSYVAWNWRGSDSTAVSNTDGTITSTVSANTTSGFSVVTYTATGVGTDSVGHGLGVAPKVVLLKSRSATGNWVYYTTQIDGSLDYLYLNLTDAKADSGWTAPSATVFPPSNTANGTTMVAYCFAEVEGFSKFGTYTGNGSTDGPFIYTGFRPAFVIAKRTDTTSGWVLIDTARDTYNQTIYHLQAESSNAEITTGVGLDILSNGFKLRKTNHNASGGTFIYMAFASNPLKHSLAR